MSLLCGPFCSNISIKIFESIQFFYQQSKSFHFFNDDDVEGIDAVNGTEVLEQDYVGPVPSVPVVGRNYYLLLATIFTLVCITWELSTSRVMARVVDSLRNNWREAEIQHQHQD